MFKERKNQSMFFVWKAYQRRAQSLAGALNLELRYYHYKWEERGKFLKTISYIGKFLATLRDLFRYKPQHVIIQLPPTPLLYAAALYSWITGARYVSDCHNAMIYGSTWIKWPLATFLLGRSHIVLVHTDDVRKLASSMRLNLLVLQDLLPHIQVSQRDIDAIPNALKGCSFVIVPWNMCRDEPVAEMFAAARLLPDIIFVLTWFYGRLPRKFRSHLPDNVYLTGFLTEPTFNALFSKAEVALVCTEREGTQLSGVSEAISLRIPLVVSDTITARRLYKTAQIFVSNDAESIAEGIREALTRRADLIEQMSVLQVDYSQRVEKQFAVFKSMFST
jgi:glycosyltransferase involved in cell wall biosynthesis